jgi:hypothetical protein
MQLESAAAAAAKAGRLVAVGAAALLISACSMGNMFSGASTTNAQYANASATQAEIAAIDPLPAIATECPEIRVRPGNEAIFRYAGQAGNPRDLAWQGIIDNQSRNCVVSNGLITVRMGLVGRVLLGPKGSQQQVEVPVRFDVERDNVSVFGERYTLPVTITSANQSGDFVKIIEGVQIPYVGGEQIIIWVGFDPA